MTSAKTIENCRICQTRDLTDVIDLGDQTITSRFPTYGDFSTPKTPITLCKCENCGLLQLRQTTNPAELYEHEYGYRSGLNATMRAHLKQYQEEIASKVELVAGDIIIDIGSNDATMLKNWSADYRRIGVDPTGAQFCEYYCGSDIELIPTYFTIENVAPLLSKKSSVKVVSSIAMFYDLPDPVKFARDIYDILADDGIWTCEQSYLLTMLKRNSIDTICHEHLEYYALTQIKEIADRAGFVIIDVRFNECNGGSFRVYFAKIGSKEAMTVAAGGGAFDTVARILREEHEYGIMSNDTYRAFIESSRKEVDKLNTFIETANANQKCVYIYGASTKGNCLLQFAGIGEQHISRAVERNPGKVGKMTSTGIKIISEEEMRAAPPDYLLVLPWHFREEIIAREHEFLRGGGHLLFPFPHFEVYGERKRVLITGSNGFIAKYVIDAYYEQENYKNTVLHKPEAQGVRGRLTPEGRQFPLIYGMARTREGAHPDIHMTFEIDLHSIVDIENIVCSIRPHVIIHLAGMSSAYEAFQNPIMALQTNGMLTANICDIVYRNKNLHGTRLFHASSSEMYKGHVEYEVNESTIKNTYHLHPYSISKILGSSVVDFYREVHGMQFSNGILFTVESYKKSSAFLLNKVTTYIRSGSTEPLVLSTMNSWRNIIHAKDAARAIYLIMGGDGDVQSAPEADNYVICNKKSVNILDVVIELFAKFGITLQCYASDAGTYYNRDTGACVLIIKNRPGFEERAIDIRGNNEKLKKIGWEPQYSVDDILEEIFRCSNL